MAEMKTNFLFQESMKKDNYKVHKVKKKNIWLKYLNIPKPCLVYLCYILILDTEKDI